MTDERTPAYPARALSRLPRGSGIIVRHYGAADRLALARRLARLAGRRGHLLLLAGTGALPRWADGRHLPSHLLRHGAGRMLRRPAPRLLLTAAAHTAAEMLAAGRAGADLVFLSPAFPTRSHPGARSLGPVRFGLAARRADVPLAALGGMTPARFRRLRPLGASAWGAIDYWSAE